MSINAFFEVNLKGCSIHLSYKYKYKEGYLMRWVDSYKDMERLSCFKLSSTSSTAEK